MDSGASNHVTADSGNITYPSAYEGNSKVVVGNGTELDVSSVGSSYLNSHVGLLHLENLLCVPTIAKNLISVSKFAHDNNVFF